MELRKDYILDRWVIISEKRAKRPDEFRPKKEPVQEGICYFCPGNEDQTPPEIGRIEKAGRWTMRWFPNKFNFVEQLGDRAVKTANSFFTYSDAYGEHEVFVETQDHNKQLHDLQVEEIRQVLKVYSERILELLEKKRICGCVQEQWPDSRHLACPQPLADSCIEYSAPSIIEESLHGSKDGNCLFCDIINIEKRSYRRVFENDTFVSFCPYASRFNFEVWLFPKRHINSITEMAEKEFGDLAEMMKRILVKLDELNADYNYGLHYAPKGKELHFHIEIMPRLAKWAGCELTSGIIINTLSPENAAKFYRGEQ